MGFSLRKIGGIAVMATAAVTVGALIVFESIPRDAICPMAVVAVGALIGYTIHKKS